MAHVRPSLPAARAVLGVSAAATPAQVVTAFRRLAQTVHPDVNAAHDAAPRFAALVAAYRVALPAARDESAAVGAGGASSVAGASPSRGRHQAVTVSGGVTAVWEAGRPIMLVGPPMVRPQRPRSG